MSDMELREPPRNISAERTVLGACMIDNACIATAREHISHTDLYDGRHQIIYLAILELDADNAAVDCISVAEYLERHHNLKKIGGRAYLAGLEDEVLTTQNIDHYLDLIRKAALRRELIAETQQLLDLAASSSLDILRTHTNKITDIGLELSANGSVVENATDWLKRPEPDIPAAVLSTFDLGDKVLFVAPSKARKSFFAIQFAISIAAGNKFLHWTPASAMTVLYVQFEIRAHHFERRVHRMARAMKISPEALNDNLHIINARGDKRLWKDKVFNMASITRIARDLNVKVIMFDPLYKLLDGDENSAEDMKPLLRQFDALAEELGTVVVYVHHDAKGIVGLRDKRDRGAGSGVLVRDIDASIILTPHKIEEALCVEVLLRNYPPQEPVVIEWKDNHFVTSELSPEIETKPNSTNISPTTDADIASLLRFLDRIETPIGSGSLKAKLRDQLGFSKTRAEEALKICAERKLIIRKKEGFPAHMFISKSDNDSPY